MLLTTFSTIPHLPRFHIFPSAFGIEFVPRPFHFFIPVEPVILVPTCRFFAAELGTSQYFSDASASMRALAYSSAQGPTRQYGDFFPRHRRLCIKASRINIGPTACTCQPKFIVFITIINVLQDNYRYLIRKVKY